MALLPVPSDSDWPSEILDAAKEEFLGVIDVINPVSAGDYNPRSDEIAGGVDGAKIISNRAARIQHIRLPLDTPGAYEKGSKRRYRFQIEAKPGDPAISNGFIVRVVDGGRDPRLTKYAFQVVAATNSDHMAVRTIETTMEFGAVAA